MIDAILDWLTSSAWHTEAYPASFALFGEYPYPAKEDYEPSKPDQAYSPQLHQ